MVPSDTRSSRDDRATGPAMRRRSARATHCLCGRSDPLELVVCTCPHEAVQTLDGHVGHLATQGGQEGGELVIRVTLHFRQVVARRPRHLKELFAPAIACSTSPSGLSRSNEDPMSAAAPLPRNRRRSRDALGPAPPEWEPLSFAGSQSDPNVAPRTPKVQFRHRRPTDRRRARPSDRGDLARKRYSTSPSLLTALDGARCAC